jgi:hypothetical protein
MWRGGTVQIAGIRNVDKRATKKCKPSAKVTTEDFDAVIEV